EVEPGRGFIHPAPEDRDRVIGIAFQETAGEVDALEVLGLRAAPGAGREAASDLAAVAERRVALLEELELIGEPDRRRGATVAELQEVGELPDRLADPGAPTERAEVERAVPGDIAHDEEAGRSGAGDLDEAELPVPLVLDVVERAPALDLTEFGQERGEFVRSVIPLDPVRSEERRVGKESGSPSA